MSGYQSLKMKSSTGVVIQDYVNTFADLPPASARPGEYWVVNTSTGIWVVNRKEAGVYLSNGVSWSRLGNWDLAFRSDNFGVYDSTDPNKVVGLDVSGVTSGSKRIIKMADYNIDLNSVNSIYRRIICF